MNSVHNSKDTTRQPLSRRSRRCFRHHVWMAACTDCRDAHPALAKSATERPNPAR